MLLDDLKSLHPTTFEHLVFDLLVLSGLQNATWRTPGADAGRDIEGTALAVDLSGNVAMQRWYAECKRYEATLDWPAVYAKIAYADNHGADFLLLCTTASLSPRCKEELSRRELSRPRLQVRYWDGPALETRLAREGWLLAKYALSNPANVPPDGLNRLISLAHKSTQTAYAHASVSSAPHPSLEYAAALVELIDARAADASVGSRIHRPYRHDRDAYEWCIAQPALDVSNFDGPGLRAVVSALRFYARASAVSIDAVATSDPAAAPASAAQRAILLTPQPNQPLGTGHTLALPLIAIAADFELTFTNEDAVRVQCRGGP